MATVNTAYNQATQGIKAQVPALQQLYGNLIQGLQAQNNAQVQNVVDSAQQRGVARQGLEGDTQAMLANALAQGQGQLALGQAQGVGGLRGQIGQTNVARQQARVQQADINSTRRLAAQENQLALQQMQQQYNVREAQYQKAQAEAAARAASRAAETQSLADLSESDIKRALRLQLNSVAMANGKVGPRDLAGALKTYRQAGLSDEKFWKEFQGFWDDKNPSYDAGMRYYLEKK